MRSLRIFALGTGVLFAALSLHFWEKWALLVVTAVPLIFLIAGQLYLVDSKRCIRLWMNPAVLEDGDQATLRLSGKIVSHGFFKRWYEFEIQVGNLWWLGIVALTSLATMAGVWVTDELPIPGSYWYYAGLLWWFVCYLAWRWLWERRAMRQEGFALGSFRVVGMAGPRMKRVSYQFTDNNGEHWGGSFRTLYCDTQDDLTVVFYDERNPNISVPASAMMFHRLIWADVQSAEQV